MSKPTYSQDWPAYNQAKTHEYTLMKQLLEELLTCTIDEPSLKRGRTGYSLREKIFCMCMKVYHKSDLRKTVGILRELVLRSPLSRAPSFKTLDNFFHCEELTVVLNRLLLLSAMPLAALETTGAIDSTGFTTSQFAQWHDYKWGKPSGKERVWVKAHAFSGCRTNTIISMEVTISKRHDAPMLKPVVGEKSRYFSMTEFVADKAYLSREILEFLSSLELYPYIPLKSNSSNRGHGSFMWKKIYRHFHTKNEHFMQQYHQRSNAETTFHMLKKRFGHAVMNKSFVAQTNEILCKALCHNLCVLIAELFESGVEIDFMTCVKKQAAV